MYVIPNFSIVFPFDTPTDLFINVTVYFYILNFFILRSSRLDWKHVFGTFDKYSLDV